MTILARARRHLLLFAVCVLAPEVAAQTLTVSPSSLGQGGEAFLQLSLSSLLASDSAVVIFNGPGGSATLPPQMIVDGSLIVWVPQSTMKNAGSYNVEVDVTRTGATTRYGPAQLAIIALGVAPFALTLPEVVTETTTNPSGAAVAYTATSSDGTPGSCSPPSGSTFPVGTTTVNCSANNGTSTASGAFPVVLHLSGSVPFSLNLPEVVTAEATSASGAVVTYSATSSNGTAVTCSPVSGSTFPLGRTNVNCSAGGLTGSFAVFVHDTVRPVLSLPANITTSNAVVTFNVTATDAIDPAPVVECNPASGSTFAAGTTVVTCSATDSHANTATGAFLVTVNVEYSFSQSVYEINTAAGQTVTYTSVLPAAATERLEIRNSAGTIVRTLVNAARNAGTHHDVWNGRDDGGALLPDGPYSFLVTMTQGSTVQTYDLSNQMRGTSETQYPYPSCSALTMPLDSCANNANQTYDVFANDPLKIHYTVAEPSRVHIVFTDLGETPGNCTGNEVCVVNGEYRPTGSFIERWAAVTPSGNYAPQRGRLTVVRRTSTFPKNVVLLSGAGQPALISNLTLTPTVFGLEHGRMKVEFDLTTFAGAPAAITLQMVRQEYASILRTVTLSPQSPGHVTYEWDGKAASGHPVAPGEYSLIVTATAYGVSTTAKSRFLVQY